MKFYSYQPDYDLKIRINREINELISASEFIGGKYVQEFEKQFAYYTNAENVVSCASGLDALFLSLKALNLADNSKIAVSGHTFFATWLAILNAGHQPIGVDVDLSNLQMDPEALRKVIDEHQIAAVIYVHMHGFLGDIEKVKDICNTAGTPLIEDCAQAHGLRLGTRHVGTFGAFGAFSFYPTKNLPALGDGGAVISKSNSLDLIRSRANYGWTNGNREEHHTLALNSRLDSLQACILSEHLKLLEEWNGKRRQIADEYRSVLMKSKSLVVPSGMQASVWHHFPILTNQRNRFLCYLDERKIPFQIHYPKPSHLQPAYLNSPHSFNQSMNLKNTELISKNIVSLPLHPWVEKEHLDYVLEALFEWTNEFEK